ncbi:alpha/beta hydrolase [Naumannella sp. ID2617S]|nr:alpha/beta hydrolase [Naumannella sp. ID2617S]
MGNDAFSTETVTSSDGTTIGYRRHGNGMPLTIVHGSISTGEQWEPFAQATADRLQTFAMDRRGRATSIDDGTGYGLDAEAADIAAVLAAAGPDAAVLGHSFGGVATLHALVTGQLTPRALVLYEPPVPVDGPVVGDQLDEYARLVEAGDHDGALTHALAHFVRVSDEEIEGLRQTPLWAGLAALTPTWTRELAQIDGTVDELAAMARIELPTLLLVGAGSPGHLVSASEHLARTMPNATLHRLQAPGHFAHVIAPGEVGGVVAEFLAGAADLTTR